MTSTSVTLPFKRAFLPLAMSFVENGATGFGYSPSVTNMLLLAAEELFLFYVLQSDGESTAEITLTDKHYKLMMKFSFEHKNPDFRSLNMTWKPEQDEESLGLLGPMLAARSVSSLSLDFGEQDRVIINAEIFRGYEAKEGIKPAVFDPAGYVIKPPTADAVSYFVRMLDGAELPDFLRNADMAADIFSCGDLSALFAERAGNIAGGVFWKKNSESLSEVFGPYVLCEDKDITERLMTELISQISRGETTGLLRRQGVLADYEKYFDLLGEISLQNGDKQTYYYRQMEEDYGSAVYCGDGLAGFLNGQYEKLALLRSVREKVIKPETLRDSSVLMVSLDYSKSFAALRVLCAGRDMKQNLDEHIKTLKMQGIKDLILEINVAKGEDVAFAQVLGGCGFVPVLIVPDEKNGDVAVFKYSEEAAI